MVAAFKRGREISLHRPILGREFIPVQSAFEGSSVMRPVVTLVAIAAAFCGSSAVAQTSSVRIGGIIEKLEGQTLSVRSTDGQELSIVLPADVRITALTNKSLSDIKPGDFVGSAAVADANGKLHAKEVHIFPGGMRGSGEGNRPMAGPQESMTNATVAEVIGAPDGRSLKLQYPGGQQEIDVGADVRVVEIIPGDLGLLKPGATVAVFASKAPDGSLSARSIQAEKDGVKPLM
jgi:hypothetical protein